MQSDIQGASKIIGAIQIALEIPVSVRLKYSRVKYNIQ